MHISEIKGKYFPVLDYGFCGLVDYLGSDSSITRAARCSYGKGTKQISDDKRLIRTLIREEHTSPLEMCEIVLHVGMPIFVCRQWIRHRTASVNEMSGRYSVLPDVFYTPNKERHTLQDSLNKQGSSSHPICGKRYKDIVGRRQKLRKDSYELYKDALDAGLSREVARIDLPVATYTYLYWKIDLKNLLHFLKLRLDEHAQQEIREYAKIIAGIVKVWVPDVWEAFNDYVLQSVSFSSQEQRVLVNISLGMDKDMEITSDYIASLCFAEKMTIRESNAFISKFKKIYELKKENYNFDLPIDKAKDAEFYEYLFAEEAISNENKSSLGKI